MEIHPLLFFLLQNAFKWKHDSGFIPLAYVHPTVAYQLFLNPNQLQLTMKRVMFSPQRFIKCITANQCIHSEEMRSPTLPV